jgi:hypothetical protein
MIDKLFRWNVTKKVYQRSEPKKSENCPYLFVFECIGMGEKKKQDLYPKEEKKKVIRK